VSDPALPFLTRLWFCWVCFFRVLFDGAFAARAFAAREATSALPPAAPRELEPALSSATTPTSVASARAMPVAPGGTPAPEPVEPALQLLSLLQREGRLVDFLQQDISAFADADVGAAARVVHEGCRRALGSHASIVSVRSEAEGARVTIERLDASEVKLTGNVAGSAPYRGVLRHRGWRIEGLKLPTRIGSGNVTVVAPAEVEL
jgi:hypothetical protein